MAKASTARKKETSKKSQRPSSKKKARKAAVRRTSGARKPPQKRHSATRAGKRTPTKKRAGKKPATRAAKKKAAKKKAEKKPAGNKAAKTKTAPKKTAKASGGRTAAKTAPAPPVKKHVEAPPGPAVKKIPGPSYSEILARLPYQEGSFVVHPKYGLGKVDRVVDRRLSTGVVPCMEIGFPYQEMKLTIPVDQVERSGLREPIGRREIGDVFRVLKGRATFDAKRRSAKRVVDYRKRLSQGDPTSLAEAVRDLARLSLRKSLSYEERKILSTALRILSREVALARGREADVVREEIESIVYR